MRHRLFQCLGVGWVVLVSGWCASGPVPQLPPGLLEALECAPPGPEAVFRSGSQPGNLYFPGEPVHVTLSLANGEQGGSALTLEVIEVAGARDGESGARRVAQGLWMRLGSVGTREYRFERAPASTSASEVECRDLPVPDRHGTYVVAAGGGTGLRRFVCTLARVPRPRAVPAAETSMIGDGTYLTADGTDPETCRQRALALARLGVRLVRVDLSWNEPQPGRYDWRRADAVMNALDEAGLKALVTLSGHPEWSMPLGEPTPSIVRDWPDRTCQPKYYEAFGLYVHQFCARYWRDGSGPLWALEHWDRPWEGVSGTGWGSDRRHYLALMQQLTRNARRVDPRIRTAAAGSIVNTEVKFLVGDRPEDALQWVDILSDRGALPWGCYGPSVARHWHKESLDAGLVVSVTEMDLLQAMVQALASGQRWVAPWEASRLAFILPGVASRSPMPTPLAVAVAAFNREVGHLRFRGCLNLTHLPWAFQFSSGRDFVAVLVGRLRPMDSGDPLAVCWGQMNLGHGGTLTVPNADGFISWRDLAGNPVFEGQAEVKLAMDEAAYYMSCTPGGDRLLEKRLHAAWVEGIRPVELIARDLTTPLDLPDAHVRVTVHNLLNRPVQGTVQALAPDGIELAEDVRRISLGDGETRHVQFPIKSVRRHPANAYPFGFRFESSAGAAEWREVLHDVAVRKTRITVDGRLDDWERIPGIPVQAGVWDPETVATWGSFAQARLARTNARFAELKLAWSDRHLFVAAQVNDPTPWPGHVRLEDWDEEQYFRGPADDGICEQLRPFASLILALPTDLGALGAVQSRPDWAAFQRFVATNAPAREAVESGAAQVYFRARQHRKDPSYAAASHVYKRAPWVDRPYVGDTLQLGFDVKPGAEHHRVSVNTEWVPEGFHATPDTDYEYCAYACRDGATEVWRQMAPGIPRSHPVPRQPRAAFDQGPVREAECLVIREGTLLVYELAIPWKELKEWAPKPGHRFGFIFRINDEQAPPLTFGVGKSATRLNSLSLHPYHEPKPDAGVQWLLVD